MRPLRILIADDHEVMRNGVRELIEHEPGWQVCGTAATGREAVEAAKKLRPEVVVLDMTMPELDGLEALREIKRALPDVEVVIFSAYHSEEVIEQLFDAGAKSYIQKADAGRSLVAAIKSIAEHKPFFTSDISDVLFARFLSLPAGRKQNGKGHTVTNRERDVIRLLAQGSSNKEVANSLGISIRRNSPGYTYAKNRFGLPSRIGSLRDPQ